MNLENLIRGACLLLCLLSRVQGLGCANRETYDLPEVNMCEQGSLTLGRVVISVTSEDMGSNTGCICVIRPRTPGKDLATVFVSKATDSNVTRCGESQIQINPFSNYTGTLIQNFTCMSPLNSNSYSGRTMDEVTITLTRADTSVGVSYCLLLQPDRWQEDDMDLSCQSGLTPPPAPSTSSTSSTSTTSTTPTTTTSSTTSAPTTTTPIAAPSTTLTASTSSATPSTTTGTTTTSTSTPTTAVPTAIPTSPPSSTSSSSPTSSPTSPMSSTTSGGENPDGSSTTASGFLAAGIADSHVGAIAGGVSGAVVLIIIIIVIVVVCKRGRRQEKALLQRQSTVENQGHFNPGLEEDLHNPHYSFAEVLAMGTDRPDSMTPPGGNTASSPDTESLDGLLAASSNQSELQGDTARDNGAVSIDTTAGSAVMQMDADKTQPPQPGGDVYAVVSKPRLPVPPKPRPDKPPKPAGLSTSSRGDDVTTPAGGDVYAVVDKSRSKGGNEEKESSLPSAKVTPPPPLSPPADSSPNLVYADLEELKAEGRRPSPSRPPPEKAQETEYVVID